MKENKNKKANLTFVVIIMMLSTLLILTTLYLTLNFRNKGIKDLIFQLKGGVGGTAPVVVWGVIFSNILPFIGIMAALLVPIWIVWKKTGFNTKRSRRIKAFYPAGVFIVSCLAFYIFLDGPDYLKAVFQESTMIEENYVRPENVNLKFPEKKRNLILIYAESIESTVMNKNIGGGWEYSIMPELEKLALDNTFFSNTDKMGGFYQTEGASWSIAGITASQTGLPIKGFVNNQYKSTNFLNGAHSLGEILRQQGYNNEVIMGSKSEFGGKRQFFKNHGNYDIFDLYHAIANGYMTYEDRVWWGYQDSKLFKWSKEEITKLANKDEPFNFVIETVNTHFTDGYLEPGDVQKFPTQYENVHAQSSKQIGEFVEWAKQQDFYENTTIVIVGDHLGMQDKWYYDNMVKGYDRSVYNTFINSAVPAANNKNRISTTMDLYPTILASLGVEIEGDRMGLGTNLYSGKKTLAEEMGYKYFNDELKKNSAFYNEQILQDDAQDAITLRKKK